MADTPKPKATPEEQAEAIKELLDATHAIIQAYGSHGMPSGELYARMMPYGITFETYNNLIEILVRSGKITKTHHLLVAR
jgi:hypothetical protein